MTNRSLNTILSDLYSDVQSIERILADIGIDPEHINFNTAPINVWATVLNQLYYQEEKFHRLLITVGNEYGVLHELLPAYEDYQESKSHTEPHMTMFTSPTTDILSSMQQDLKNLRKDVDDLKIETKVELTKINARLNQLDEHLDQLTLANRTQQNDAKMGRNLLYIILGVLLLFALILLVANMGILL